MKAEQNAQQAAPTQTGLPYKRVAAKYGAASSTIKRWAKDGTLPSTRSPKKEILVDPIEVEKLLRSRPQVASIFHESSNTESPEKSEKNASSVKPDKKEPNQAPVGGVQKAAEITEQKVKSLESVKEAKVKHETPVNEDKQASGTPSPDRRAGKKKPRKPPTIGLVVSLFKKLPPHEQYDALEAVKAHFKKELQTQSCN